MDPCWLKEEWVQETHNVLLENPGKQRQKLGPSFHLKDVDPSGKLAIFSRKPEDLRDLQSRSQVKSGSQFR
ncbi:hypothetical protein RRG08_027672 [Elysia crispata]|uniref:Uncharacterized protein n=1 Tax=Elysia crispata TaxID=231223 RepID=A0AAE0XMF7_9GAST|nr:hypothetical protein RRG08_027672 [Elysia crispata]